MKCNGPESGKGEQNEGMADERAAECPVGHERRLDVLLNERQPSYISILHHSAIVTSH